MKRLGCQSSLLGTLARMCSEELSALMSLKQGIVQNCGRNLVGLQEGSADVLLLVWLAVPCKGVCANIL